MRTVRDIPLLKNIPILVRTAMNVPVENGVVTNDYRLRRSIPTIEFLRRAGAKVILISHIGEKGTETLAPVAQAMSALIPHVSFCDAVVGEKARQAVRVLQGGDVLILENLRRDKGEVANDPAFAKELSLLADAFVQDSFDACHRKHASMVGVPKLLPSYAGLLVEEEVMELQKALHPSRPSLAIIGGAKFSTKEPVLKSLLAAYDRVFVGGALANDFLKASGHTVGASLVSNAPSEEIMPFIRNDRLMLPRDVRVVKSASATSAEARNKGVAEVKEGEIILDVGSASAATLADVAQKAKTILWNGPLGNFENGFVEATNTLARAIAQSSAYSVIGGGDTIAAIEDLGILNKFSFVSTGGGAMLEYLSSGSLPGIDALAG